MPRVALKPELRVKTSQPSMLGDLPTALGIELPARAADTSSAMRTTESTAAAIARSYRRAEDYEIDDEAIDTLTYKPHAGGRPTDWSKKFPRIAFTFALLGLSDERIAQAMGIDVTTFYAWQKDHPEFSQALVDGRDNADGLVVNAMFKRATGFKFKSVKVFNDKGVPLYAPYEEFVPPDVTAGKYWLSTRRRKEGWADAEAPAGSAVSVTINVSDPQEAAKQYREIMQLEGVAE